VLNGIDLELDHGGDRIIEAVGGRIRA